MSRPNSLQSMKRPSSAQKYCSRELPDLPYEVRKPTCLKSNTYSKGGHWTDREKLKFCIFMDYHKETFNRRQNRRLFKIFKCMAQFVKSRNANQCRSHHQKMQKQFIDLDQFIKRVMKVNGRKEYENYYNLCVKELQSLDTQMGMNRLDDEEEDPNISLKPNANHQQIIQQKPKHQIVQQAQKQHKQKQLPTANTYGVYTSYTGQNNRTLNQKKSSSSFLKSFGAFPSSAHQNFPQENKNGSFEYMNMAGFNGPNCNSQLPFLMNNLQNFNGFNSQDNGNDNQKWELIKQCNYFWNKYLQSTLKLEQRVKEEEMQVNQQQGFQGNNLRFLYDF